MAALIVFVWGLIEFLWGLSKGQPDKDGKGKQHMLWGIVGLVIMTGSLALIQVIEQTLRSFGGTFPSC